MFSSRLNWDLSPNRVAELLESKRRAGAEILDLTESNPTHAGFDYPPEMPASLAGPRSLLYEPHPAGLTQAREAVAGYYRAANIGIDRILLTTSTSDSYAYLFKLLADPGDEILAPRPSYPLFEFLASLESVRVIQYPLFYDGQWAIDFEGLRSALTPRTRAIVVVNPNNPTGSFLKREEWSELTRLASRHGLAILCDEVFSDYGHGADPHRFRTAVGHDDVLSFALSGLSKVCGLPQMKLGWMVVNGPAAERRAAIERLELIADTYLAVGTPVQHAAARLLNVRETIQTQIRRRVADNLALLRDRVGADSACRVLGLEGGWYATLQVPRTRGEEEIVLEALEHGNVLVQPGFFYDFESEPLLVLSLLTPTPVFREGMARLLPRIEA